MRTLIEADGAPAFAVPLGTGDAPLHQGLLIEGAQGWGEFSPPPDADAALIARCFTAATEAGTIGWPDMARGRVPVAVAVPAVDPEHARRLVAASGCRTADVTVGIRPDSTADDAARIAAVRSALGSDGMVRCDAGGRWDPGTAIAVLPQLDDAAGGLQFVANPCATRDDTAAVRHAVDIPVAAPAEFADAADIVLLQAAAMGGVRRALRWAERTGLPCVVTAPTETSIGLSAGLALAGALPDLPYACALGLRLSADLVAAARSLVPVDGHLPVAPMPPSPEPAQLARYRLTDAGRVSWWQDRLRAAMSV